MRKFLISALIMLLTVSWGVPVSSGESEAEMQTYHLSNPNAGETTKAVYAYLCSLNGAHTLSAQQESTWMGSADYEMDILMSTTGKLPAIRGLDYISDDFDGVNERALEWWRNGGLVTICWHTGSNFCGEWTDCMQTEISDWDAALTPGTWQNRNLMLGMQKAGDALKALQEEGVTVLWRPFHEFDGKWFWWGKGGAENFVKLWRMMYDYYTNELGLNNLIWVLGYSHLYEDYDGWYPGDEYVDVIGSDSYQGGVQNGLYQELRKITTSKPYAFHECGSNPTAQELATTPWAWFMTWHTTSLTQDNTPEGLNALYNSEQVITRDELPKFHD